MKTLSHGDVVESIASVTASRPLASAVHRSVASAIRCPSIRLVAGGTVWDVFETSLNAAIRDIAEHPLGKLFRRLIRYGPHDPDFPQSLVSDNETTLSDPECASAVQFIFSHMVNRFKGELSELLAMEPCTELVHLLRQKGDIPSGATLYWGDTVEERRRISTTGQGDGRRWGSFTKGADGLIVDHMPTPREGLGVALGIHGIVEVKSMPLPKKRVLDQIKNHMTRLGGGVRLAGHEFLRDDIRLNSSSVIRIMALPSTWKLSREWRREEGGRAIALPECPEPPLETRIEEIEPNLWRITLAWSKESLEQAAYEMTFGYMAQVGRHVFAGEAMPKEWEDITPDEAGCNAIKMMLYYIPLRPISKHHVRLATRLYNIYSFGYPLGADSKQMLWPEDFPDKHLDGAKDNAHDRALVRPAVRPSEFMR